ncbi:MAG: hypothetical protein E7612_02915 [Ruminococcaceae bacterium]|nr:hypothetical protein [Oscillospiraceae bacterium]
MVDFKERGYVTYEDFGAVGDGVTDDFLAIYKTHEYANEHKLSVKGTPGKTYYIFETRLNGEKEASYVTVKTNVDWCGAHFIIDDTPISLMEDNPYRELARKNIFIVMPEDEHKKTVIDDPDELARINREGINTKTKYINLGIDWNGPVMIIPYSEGHKVFRRRGYSQFAGEPMHEIIVLESDGKVSEETPIMFDYAGIDYIDVYRLDPSSAITIENGVFTTRESRVNHKILQPDGTYTFAGRYIARGTKVARSYTTVKNIEHRLEGWTTLLERVDENREGSPYAGFFRAEYANRITYKDCIMPGRFSYGVRANGHSSYNFGALCVNKIVLDGCVQPNFWVSVDPETYEMKDATVFDKSCTGNARPASKDVIAGMGYVDVKGVTKPILWGIGGTNYCKNMEYLNSTLTRFDAHAGLYHGKIINCNISGMELTGVGNFILEDSDWYPYTANTPLLYLRSDYGYHWDGDILIKNTKAFMYDDSKLNIAHYYYNNWYFGYTCAFPNITIDNLAYYNAKTWERRDAGYGAKLFLFRENAKKMHLYDSGEKAIFACLDEDGDGYIDEPIFDINKDGVIDQCDLVDLDGDGKEGNTSLKYADYIDTPDYRRGITHPSCTTNLNAVKPPKYFKVINNETEDGRCVCTYTVKDTSLEQISDGLFRDESKTDSFGGFFGTTEFIYGAGKGESFIGTADKNGVTNTFFFAEEYDS